MYVCMCVCIAGDANEVTRLKDEVEKLKRILAEKDKQIASLQETVKSKKAAGAAAQVLRYGGFVSRCMYVVCVCMCVCMYVCVGHLSNIFLFYPSQEIVSSRGISDSSVRRHAIHHTYIHTYTHTIHTYIHTSYIHIYIHCI